MILGMWQLMAGYARFMDFLTAGWRSFDKNQKIFESAISRRQGGSMQLSRCRKAVLQRSRTGLSIVEKRRSGIGWPGFAVTYRV
jgi:hypothetical protein